jgi:aldehyde:ferredoxin oxidoreductase
MPMESKTSNNYGYGGTILRVDLSSGEITRLATADYAGQFLGGRGIAARIYWDEVPPEVGALAPENRVILANGPLAGFPGLSSSRWLVAGKAPATDTAPDRFSYSNLGGTWGAQLKFAGYDAVVVQGRADKPVYLLIQNDTVEIKDAASLWGKGTTEVRDILKAEYGNSLRVVACGPAGERGLFWSTIIADNDSSGSGGFGAVMGAKNLKAVAVRGTGMVTAARRDKLDELRSRIRYLKWGQAQIMWDVHQEAALPKHRPQACYGCIGGCVRQVSEAEDGTCGKTLCFSGTTYVAWARRYYGEKNEVPFWANRICDYYGIDVHPLIRMLTWLDKCYQQGILTEEGTGLPLSRIGSLEFIQTLVHKIALEEGFGELLAQGAPRAAALVGGGAEEHVVHSMAYDPRMYIVSGIFYAMEPRMPIQQLHEIVIPVIKWGEWRRGVEGAYVTGEVLLEVARRYWGGELAVDFSTYQGKAVCAQKIQDRTYAKESLILCDYPWPLTTVRQPADHVGDPTLESQVFSAVTGRDMDEFGLYRMGERIFNLQRAILSREGHRGREGDTLPEYVYTMPLAAPPINPEGLAPGKGGQPISMTGNMLGRDKFQDLLTEYYALRGWDVASGLQTRIKLEELGLDDVARDLVGQGLAV